MTEQVWLFRFEQNGETFSRGFRSTCRGDAMQLALVWARANEARVLGDDVENERTHEQRFA